MRYIAVVPTAKRVLHIFPEPLFIRLNRRLIYLCPRQYFRSSPQHLLHCLSLTTAARTTLLDSDFVSTPMFHKRPIFPITWSVDESTIFPFTSAYYFLLTSTLFFLYLAAYHIFYIRVKTSSRHRRCLYINSIPLFGSWAMNTTNNSSTKSFREISSVSTLRTSLICWTVDFLVSHKEGSSPVFSYSPPATFLQLHWDTLQRLLD